MIIIFPHILYELDFVMNMDNSFDTAFLENWEDWQNPIISYAQAYRGSTPKYLQDILQSLVPDNLGMTMVQV